MATEILFRLLSGSELDLL